MAWLDKLERRLGFLAVPGLMRIVVGLTALVFMLVRLNPDFRFVLDLDPATGRVSTESVDRILSSAEVHGLAVEWVLETHVHADHLSAALVIKERTGAKVAMGSGVVAAGIIPPFAALPPHRYRKPEAGLDTMVWVVEWPPWL